MVPVPTPQSHLPAAHLSPTCILPPTLPFLVLSPRSAAPGISRKWQFGGHAGKRKMKKWMKMHSCEFWQCQGEGKEQASSKEKAILDALQAHAPIIHPRTPSPSQAPSVTFSKPGEQQHIPQLSPNPPPSHRVLPSPVSSPGPGFLQENGSVVTVEPPAAHLWWGSHPYMRAGSKHIWRPPPSLLFRHGRVSAALKKGCANPVFLPPG